MFNVGDKVRYTGLMQLIGRAPFRIFYLYPDGTAMIVSADLWDYVVNVTDLLDDDEATQEIPLIPPGQQVVLPSGTSPAPVWTFNNDLPSICDFEIYGGSYKEEPVCECGGDKHGWAHSDWCKKSTAGK